MVVLLPQCVLMSYRQDTSAGNSCSSSSNGSSGMPPQQQHQEQQQQQQQHRYSNGCLSVSIDASLGTTTTTATAAAAAAVTPTGKLSLSTVEASQDDQHQHQHQSSASQRIGCQQAKLTSWAQFLDNRRQIGDLESVTDALLTSSGLSFAECVTQELTGRVVNQSDGLLTSAVNSNDPVDFLTSDSAVNRNLPEANCLHSLVKVLDNLDSDATESDSDESVILSDSESSVTKDSTVADDSRQAWLQRRAQLLSRWTWVSQQLGDLDTRLRAYTELCERLDSAKSWQQQWDVTESNSRCLPPPQQLLLGRRRVRPQPQAGAVRCGCSPPLPSCVLCQGWRNRVIQLGPRLPLGTRAQLLDPACHPAFGPVDGKQDYETAVSSIFRKKRCRRQQQSQQQQQSRRARNASSTSGKSSVSSSVAKQRRRPAPDAPTPESVAKRRHEESVVVNGDASCDSPPWTPRHYEPIEFKEIDTPAWRVAGGHQHQHQHQPDCISVYAKAKSSASALKLRNLLVTDEMSEDLTDSAYYMRHRPKEKSEHLRNWGRNLNSPIKQKQRPVPAADCGVGYARRHFPLSFDPV